MKYEFGSEKERQTNNSKFHLHNSKFSFLEATELARLIRGREASAEETMEACLDQVERTNPRVNAIVTLAPRHL